MSWVFLSMEYCSIICYFDVFHQFHSFLCICLVQILRFIPKYFILWDANVNGIVFLVSNPTYSLQVYRKVNYLCILQSCYNYFLPPGFFKLIQIFYIEIISSVKIDSFISAFPISIAFISFSRLIALTCTSSSDVEKEC